FNLFSFNDIEEIAEESVESLTNGKEFTEEKKVKEKDNQDIKIEKEIEKVEEVSNQVSEINQNISTDEFQVLSKEEIADIFLKIAVNTNDKFKTNVTDFFQKIKSSTPINKFDFLIRDMDKVLITSENGIVFLSEDEIAIENINTVNQSVEFLEYIKKQLNKIYYVIAVAKQQAIEIGNKIREEKLNNTKVKDIDIEFLKNKIKAKPSAKELAESLLQDLIIDDEE
ncbi:MAG: hypothetical protein K2H11_02150, partial [Malacoplasma sp.]|nr:hypothetical protein [Malacoplasma sp.]